MSTLRLLLRLISSSAADPKLADAGQKELHYVFYDDFSLWAIHYAKLGTLKEGNKDHVLKNASGSSDIYATVCTTNLYSQDAQSLFIPYLLGRKKTPTQWGRYDSVKKYYLQL